MKNGSLYQAFFNECISLTCRICDSDTPVDPYDDAQICAGVSFLDEQQEAFSRINTVTILSLYDADCSGIKKPGDEDEDEFVICTDRASQFRQSIVVELINARPPSQGHTSSYGVEPIREITGVQRDSLIEEFLADIPSWTDLSREEISRAFLFSKTEESDLPSAAICQCWGDEEYCQISKPRIASHIFHRSSDEEYFCYFAEGTNRGWQVAPN